MLGEGTEAPTLSLPGVVDGAPRDVDVADYVGDGILVLAFYPADFSPACDEESCDLTELDLFTMQRDVDIFAISPDSVFSHRAFAEEYSLSISLLSDSNGAAMDAYDVRLPDTDQRLAQRAVFVIDQEGVIKYAWATSDLEERPDVDAVREAVASIGGDSTAVGRYRVGHAHYIEGRRAFTSAMNSYEDRDWLISQGDFQRAMEEFQESADQFQSAVRFAESEPLEAGFTRAQEKATALWQAAEWLADSASAYASGKGEEADSYRKDAETPLETARDIGEPPNPDDITLDPDGVARQTGGADEGIGTPTDPADDETDEGPAVATDGEPGDEDVGAAVADVAVDADDDPSRDRDPGDAAAAQSDEATGEDVPSADGGDDPAAEDAAGESDEDIELDLKDPTE
ncbi:MAG: redoxin domain-containing protein [Haloarculaceae archaeon]